MNKRNCTRIENRIDEFNPIIIYHQHFKWIEFQHLSNIYSMYQNWPFTGQRTGWMNEKFTFIRFLSAWETYAPESLRKFVHQFHRRSSKADDKIQLNVRENLDIKTARNSWIKQNSFDGASIHNFIWWIVHTTPINTRIQRWKSLHCSIRPSVKMWNRNIPIWSDCSTSKYNAANKSENKVRMRFFIIAL